MKFLVVIPARGGSKGIPMKNIYPLNGKPLLSYSLEMMCQVEFDGDVVVSTDSERIKEAALLTPGIEVVDRPQDISGDKLVQGMAEPVANIAKGAAFIRCGRAGIFIRDTASCPVAGLDIIGHTLLNCLKILQAMRHAHKFGFGVFRRVIGNAGIHGVLDFLVYPGD